MISMGNGLRTLNIASLNPDPMRETATQQEIVKGMTKNKIHIASVQETHMTQDDSYMLDNYRITASSDKSEETGVVAWGTAIVIHESLHHHITQITRQRIRSLRVSLDHAKSKMPIRVISTYSPRNGHAEGERRHRRGDVKAILRKTRTRRRVIW